MKEKPDFLQGMLALMDLKMLDILWPERGFVIAGYPA